MVTGEDISSMNNGTSSRAEGPVVTAARRRARRPYFRVHKICDSVTQLQYCNGQRAFVVKEALSDQIDQARGRVAFCSRTFVSARDYRGTYWAVMENDESPPGALPGLVPQQAGRPLVSLPRSKRPLERSERSPETHPIDSTTSPPEQALESSEKPPAADKVRVIEIPGPLMKEMLEEKDRTIQRLQEQVAAISPDRRLKSLETEKAKLRKDLKTQEDDFKRLKDSITVNQNKLNQTISELQSQKQDATTDATNEARKRQTAKDNATELQNQLASRDMKISTLHKTIIQLKTLTNPDREELKRMREEETRLKQQAASNLSQIEHLRQSIKALQDEQTKNERTHLTDFRNQIRNSASKITDLESCVEQLNRNVDALEREKQDFEAHIESDHNELKKLREEQTTLRQEATSRTSDIQRLQDEAEIYRNDITTMRSESTKLQDQLKDCVLEASRTTDLERQIEELNRNVHDLEQERRESEMKALLEQPVIASNNDKLLKLQQEQTTLKQDAASHVYEIKFLQESVGKLRDEAETHKSELTTAHADLAKLQDQLKTSKQEATTHNSEVEYLQSSISMLQDKVENHKNELTTVRADALKLQDQMRDSVLETSRVADLESQIEELNRNIHDLEQEKRDSEMKALLERLLIVSDRDKLKRLQEEQAVFVQNKSRMIDLEGHIEVLNKEIQTLQQDKQDLEMRVQLTESERGELKRLQEATAQVKNERSRELAHQGMIKDLRSKLAESISKFRFDSLNRSYLILQVGTTDWSMIVDLTSKNNLSTKVRQLQELEAASQSSLSVKITELESTVLKLSEQYNQESLANTSKQAHITSLQQVIENLTHECNLLKQKHTNPHQNSRIEALELESNNLKDKECMLRDDVTRFRGLYEQQVLTASQRQSRINSLEQDFSNLKKQHDAMKLKASSNETLRSQDPDIESLRAQITQLESERDHYKSEFRAQSAGQAFGYTLNGRNRTLSHVNINAEIRHMKKQYPMYKLGQPLNTPATGLPNSASGPSNSTSGATGPSNSTSGTTGPSNSTSGTTGPSNSTSGTTEPSNSTSGPTGDSPCGGSSSSGPTAEGQPAMNDYRGSRHKGPRGPWVNRRSFADSDSDPDNATHTFQRKKGKQRATTVESDSEDSEETSSEDESSDSEGDVIESDVSHTAARYRRKGVKLHWPVEKQKQELNKLGRAILHEALGVQRNYKAFIHPGVSEERLRAFAENPGAKGPKIRNTMIDKNGATTKDLKLLLALVKLAEKIVSESKDQWFPSSIDWLSPLSKCLYRIYLAVIKSKPRIKHGELESPGQIEQRILDSHLLRNQKNGETGFRHAQKWQTRSEVCAVMIQACEQRGMSEDEDGVDKVVTIGAGTIEEAVKFTKNLLFRHQYLNDVVEFLDGIPRFEKLLFIQSGRVSKRRIRRDPRCKPSERLPPRKWPQSFYTEGYLDSLPELQRRRLTPGKVFVLLHVDFATCSPTAGVSG
ncbi:hypothetical protein F5876DRAFT_66865 [Lentinula aff. lateritia]|uniref:Uncharacterized protein n=1 Tax=Lentinula aff. lateritia TaxID=2804960 RepID=A0ACC1TW07_9AGAR|nr:hypothetical protein F5876DRAFT_66865 [Lentinula aff. lateritia]